MFQLLRLKVKIEIRMVPHCVGFALSPFGFQLSVIIILLSSFYARQSGHARHLARSYTLHYLTNLLELLHELVYLLQCAAATACNALLA